MSLRQRQKIQTVLRQRSIKTHKSEFKDLGGVAPNTPSRDAVPAPDTQPHIHAVANGGRGESFPSQGARGTASLEEKCLFHL